MLRGAFGVFVICLLLSVVMLGATHFFAQGMESEYLVHHGRFRDASRKYLSVDEQERAIADYYPRFVALYRQGVIGDEHRLSWVEALRGAGSALALPELSYEIGAQTLYAPDFPLDNGPFDVRVSEMALSLGLVHEGDLMRLLGMLEARAEGLFSVRACQLVRVSRAASAVGVGANLRAECTLDWFTLELRGSRISL